MANIAKFNGANIGDLSKLFGADKSSLAKVMGLDMPSGGTSLVASHPYSNKSGATTLQSTGVNALGQAVSLSTSTTITSAKFWLKQTQTVSGYITAAIYAATGTVGSDAKQNGSALATSSTSVLASTVSADDYEVVEFEFNYTAPAGDYVICCYYTGSAGVSFAMDDNNGHVGNAAYDYMGTFYAYSGRDAIFELYGI